jgi:hypothetical protein
MKKLYILIVIILIIIPKTKSQTTELWGITSEGGTNYSVGTIFKYDSQANSIENKLNFFKSQPVIGGAKLTFANNGLVYGIAKDHLDITSNGGSHYILFSIDPVTSIYTNLLVITTRTSYINNELILGDNGKLYVLVKYDKGFSEIHNYSILEYDITSNTYKEDFIDDDENGFEALSLTKGENGMLFGRTLSGGNSRTISGGTYGYGILFSYNTNNNEFHKIYDFKKYQQPSSNAFIYFNNTLFFITLKDDLVDEDLVAFDLTEKKLDAKYTFKSTNYYTYTDYFAIIDSTLLGVTKKLDTINNKLINGLFMYSLKNKVSFHIKHKVIEEAYDFTQFVSDEKSKTIYWISKEVKDKKRYIDLVSYNIDLLEVHKTSIGIDDHDGLYYEGCLTKISDNMILGIRSGTTNNQYFFKYDMDNKSLRENYFLGKEQPMGYNARHNMVLANNRKLYGILTYGGEWAHKGNGGKIYSGYGTLFEYTLNNGNLEKKCNLDIKPEDKSGGLIQASNNKIYGIIRQRSNSEYSIIEYSIEKDTIISNTSLNNLKNLGASGWTLGPLTDNENGNLYSVTTSGGTNSKGTIFKFNVNTKEFSIEYNFESSEKPNSTLLLADNGKLYGATSKKGGKGYGAIFEFDPTTKSYKEICSLNYGEKIENPLIERERGVLYAVNTWFQEESIFMINLKTGEIKKTPISPRNINSFTIADNGLFYLTTEAVGDISSNKHGTIFSYDPDSEQINLLKDFELEDGRNPINLISVKSYLLEEERFDDNLINRVNRVFPNPTNGIINFNLSELTNVSIEIYTNVGELIYTQSSINNRFFSVNLDTSRGLYIIKIKSNNGSMLYKLIKE